MAFSLPDGSKIYLGTAFASAVSFATITNANPAQITSTAHGLSDGNELIVLSGWEEATENVFRVTGSATNDFDLEDLDTSDTDMYAAGTGAGSYQKINTWTELQQATNIQASGGDTQFATVELLSRRNAINIPTRFNATTLTLTMADDPTLAGYAAAVAASRKRAKRPFKIDMGGSVGYGYGYISVNEMPQLNKGQVNTVTAVMTLLNRFIRYTA